VTATVQLHPVRDDGSAVDATFEIEELTVFDIVYHHKAGARGSQRSVNADYHEGLEIVLRRLALLRATILGISVDSAVARDLPAEDRELGLPFPLQLNATTDVGSLRLDITRAQKPIARRPDVKPGGGNDQKRIRLTVAYSGPRRSLEELTSLLVTGDGI